MAERWEWSVCGSVEELRPFDDDKVTCVDIVHYGGGGVKYSEISMVSVDGPKLRRGLGRRLMREAVERIRGQNRVPILLAVCNTQPFHRKCGFRDMTAEEQKALARFGCNMIYEDVGDLRA